MTSELKAAGLFIQGTDQRVPLTGVRIGVNAHGASARVTVSQRYRNTSQKPIEAVYSFPLEEGSAVCGFTVETGGRLIVGRIEEKEKAFEQYDEALAEGNGAFLVDQDRPNIFTASIGNLKPGQEATIELTYASELEQHGDDVRVMIPTTISPRYIPQSALATMDPAELDHIQPSTVIGAVPYGLTFELRYTAPQGLKSISCPSHPAHVELNGNAARLTLVGETIQLDRDVVVNVTLQRPHEAGAVVARDGDGARAVMLNFFPDLKSEQRAPSEFIFIVDRSGSMEGQSFTQARNALLLALRSMDEGDQFNVVGFGTRMEQLFLEPVPYCQATLEQATQKLASWTANLGGTELLRPLKFVLEESPRGEIPRQVMLLTDGQVGNDAECIALAVKHAGVSRIFTFGIGHGASEHLVRGLARASGGQAEFIQPNERIEPKVMRQFARAAAPYLNNVRIDWGTLNTDLVAPHSLPSLFRGDRLTVYGRVTGGVSGEVAIVAESSAGPIRIPLTVDLEHVSDAPEIPVLMARHAIREIEEGRGEERGSNQVERRKKSAAARVLELALRYQILSSQTSFIAVEERVLADKTAERAELQRVPVALTSGWGGMHLDAVCAAPAPMSRSRRKRSAAPLAGGGEPMSAAPMDASVLGKARRMLRRDAFAYDDPGESVDSLLCDDGHVAESLMSMPAEAVPPQTGFLYLTHRQNANGSFDFHTADISLLSLDLARWKAFTLEVQGLAGADFESVAATLAALALLENRFAARQVEWQMIADKAERWLAKQSLTLPAGETSAKEWAKQMLNL